jgi:MFS family permease
MACGGGDPCTEQVTPAHRPEGPLIFPTFAALADRNFRVWSAANLVSTVGAWMQVLAVNWYVLQSTGSAGLLGVVVMLQALPGLILAPVGGVIADRLPARPMLVCTRLMHAAVALALAVLVSGHGHLPFVYAVSLIGGFVTALETPIMGRFNATLVDRKNLGNAISLSSVISSTGRILGMAVGGVAIAILGAGPLLVVNAAGFVVVVVVLLRLDRSRLHPLRPEPAEAGAETFTKPGLRAGLAYVARQPVVLLTLGLAVVLGSVGRNFQVTMAAMANGPLHSGAAGYGVLSTAFAAGTIGGGLLAARSRHGLGTLVGVGALAGTMQAVTAFVPTTWAFAACLVPIAAGAVIVDTTVTTRVQLDTHSSMRGRILGVAAAAGSAAGVIGAPLLGWMCVGLGPRSAVSVAGAAAVAGCLVFGFAIARRMGVPINSRTLGSVFRRPAPAV